MANERKRAPGCCYNDRLMKIMWLTRQTSRSLLLAAVAAAAFSTAPAVSAPPPDLTVVRGDGGEVAALKHPKLSSQLVMLADAASRPALLGLEDMLPRELEGAVRAYASYVL